MSLSSSVRDSSVKYMEKSDPLPEGRIQRLLYSIFSTEEIDKLSVLNVKKTDDLRDERLGPRGRSRYCGTCSNVWSECPGHIGSMAIPRLINPLMRTTVVHTLSSVCNDCGGVLISEEQMRAEGILEKQGLDRLSEIRSSVVSKGLKLVCPNSLEENAEEENIVQCRPNPEYFTDSDSESKKEVGITYKIRGTDVRRRKGPEDIYEILDAISDRDAQLLGFNVALGQHPRKMIMERLVVVPYCVRDDPTFGGIQMADDLTLGYSNILSKLNKYNNPRINDVDRRDAKESLYQAISALMKNNGSITGRRRVQKDISGKISGKEGAARAISQGKRVSNVGRTVAAPGLTFSPEGGGDTSTTIKTDEVGVPRKLARELTRVITVTGFNADDLQRDLDQDRVNYIIMSSGKFKGVRIPIDKTFKVRNRDYRLQLGDKVYRQLKDNDFVIFHRGPTLETGNMLVLKTKITDELVLRPSVSITSPMNLDFDGDETQIHVMQTPEAYAEATMIAGISKNLISYSTGKAVIALTYDSLTGAYLLTQEGRKIDPAVHSYVIEPLSEYPSMATLQERLNKYGIDELSGRGLFSASLPEGFYYNNKGVVVKDGILISGRLSKATLGTTRGGFVSEMRKQFPDSSIVVDFITNARVVASRWMQVTGYTIDLDDCLPDSLSDNALLLERSIDQTIGRMVKLQQDNYRKNKAPEEIRNDERVLLKAAGDARNIQDKIVKNVLDQEHENNIITSISSGSKGTLYNMDMILASIGQQVVNGKRPESSLPGRRSLVSFQPREEGSAEPPESRGFCVNSLGKSLNPSELFFHMGSVREALVKGAKSTADTGDTERTTIKSCEDVNIGRGRAVVGANNTLVQSVFGGDAMDPRESELTNSGRLPRDYKHLGNIISSKYELL